MTVWNVPFIYPCGNRRAKRGKERVRDGGMEGRGKRRKTNGKIT